jgi:hypothetical protein
MVLFAPSNHPPPPPGMTGSDPVEAAEEGVDLGGRGLEGQTHGRHLRHARLTQQDTAATSTQISKDARVRTRLSTLISRAQHTRYRHRKIAPWIVSRTREGRLRESMPSHLWIDRTVPHPAQRPSSDGTNPNCII